MTSLFAAALDGDQAAEALLGELALDDERAADAYLAVVAATVREHQPGPGAVAASDQIIARVRDTLAAEPPRGAPPPETLPPGQASGGC